MEVRQKILENLDKAVYRLAARKAGRSRIWTVFSQIIKSNDCVLKGYVYCRICRVLLKYNGKQTSNLVRHHCYKDRKIHEESEQMIESKTTIPEKQDNNLNMLQEKMEVLQEPCPANELQSVLDGCVQWVLEDCRPFSIVNDSGFRKLANLLLALGEEYGKNIKLTDILPDTPTIARHILALAAQRKQQIQTDLAATIRNGGASITTYYWCDNYVKRNFMCLTLHYMHKCKFKELILGVKSFDLRRCSVSNVRSKIKSVPLQYDIGSLDNIIFVTDRSAIIVNALCDYTRLNCSTMLFTNALDEAFNATEELRPLIESCQQLVKYLKKDNYEQLLHTATPKSRCNSRWHALYSMFKAITDNWSTINPVQMAHASHTYLHADDINTLENLVGLCQQFEIILMKLQGTRCVTLCYVLPSIQKLKSICCITAFDNASIASLKTHMLQQIELTWTANLSVYHKAAAFLYPPTNNRLDAESLAEVKAFCIAEMLKFIPEPRKENTTATTSACTNIKQELEFFFPDLMQNTEVKYQTGEDELALYSRALVRIVPDFDPIQWWNHHSFEYPQLSKVAIHVLSIPASTPFSEHAVALASNMLIEKRNCFTPKAIDAILFLNSFMQNA